MAPAGGSENAGIGREYFTTSTVVKELRSPVVDSCTQGIPTVGELVAIAKHYPNVFVDLCWAGSIDPYSNSGFSPTADLEFPRTPDRGQSSRSASLSPIAIETRFVFALGTDGRIEASATRSC
jgi:hypothetical protein